MQITKKIIIATATLGLVLSPLMAFGQTDKSNPPDTGFCTRLPGIRTKFTGGFPALEATRKEKGQTIVNNLTQLRNSKTQEVQRIRDTAAKKLDQSLADLNSVAKDSAQIQAITTFKTTVQTAEAARKTAVDAAQQTFQTTQSKVVTQRQQDIINATTTFQPQYWQHLPKLKLPVPLKPLILLLSVPPSVLICKLLKQPSPQ